LLYNRMEFNKENVWEMKYIEKFNINL
jgi:hypothetical protein